MPYGTLTTLDTLAALRAASGTVAEIGEDVAFESISAALDVHNQLLREAIDDFVEDTSDRLRRYGGPDSMQMEELDEFGTAGTQKISAGTTVGFPLRFYGGSLQWTRLWFQNKTGAELAAQVDAMMDADVKNILKQLKWAILNPVNYTFEDRRVDHVQLSVKALVNADGAPIPIAPDGTTFNGSTHTHYLATASFSAADLTSLVNTVVEHFLAGKVQVIIPQALETTVRGFTGFYPYTDARLIQTITTTNARENLDMMNLTNRAIGVFGPAEIWVKPWAAANYVIAFEIGGQQKALVRRTRGAGTGNLELLFDNEIYPLRAQSYGREFGFGVWNRVAAAVLYTGGASYVAPSIASL